MGRHLSSIAVLKRNCTHLFARGAEQRFAQAFDEDEVAKILIAVLCRDQQLSAVREIG